MKSSEQVRLKRNLRRRQTPALFCRWQWRLD